MLVLVFSAKHSLQTLSLVATTRLVHLAKTNAVQHISSAIKHVVMKVIVFRFCWNSFKKFDKLV